jgi:hypothetical protein
MTNQEIDRLVATEIMGWKDSNPYLEGLDMWMESINGNPNSHKVIGRVKDFKPSTDISDAWKIIHKIRNLRFYKRAQFKKKLQELITPNELKKDGLLVDAEEIILLVKPVDICNAALATVGVEVE